MRVRKAQSLVKSGNVGGAEAALARILEQHPSNARAQQAMKRLRKQIRTANEPDPADQKRISELVVAGRYADAFAAAKELVGTHPKSVFLWNILGTMCLKFDDPAASEPCFKRAITLDPAVSAPLIGLAAARKIQGAGTEAIALLEMALERDPRHLAAQKQLASLYAEIACHDVALEAFRRVVDLDPDNPAAVRDVAVTLSRLKRHGEALDLVEQLTGRWPGRTEDFALGGEIANSAGRYPEAIAWFERVPDHDSDDLATLNILKARGQIADWRDFEAQPRKAARIGRQRRGINPGPVLSLADDPILQLGHAERASAAGFPQVAGPAPAPATARPRRLRIGYFSSDFEDHATMVLMGGLFEVHDRERFEIFVYSYGPECDRPVRQRLVDAAEHFRDVRKTTDSELAELARADGIDIAIDLKGYTEGSRSASFAHRVAPVQISWLGWPGTMGNEAFDYAIVDRVTVPDAQRIGFSESLIYLPDTYQVNDSDRQVPGVALARAEYGLPEDGFVFCCFNATYKITPREFDIWMRLLDRVEGSVLWLLRSNEWAEDNLRAEAERRGISGTRLVFADRAKQAAHLARHGAADLFLDTFIINAHTTCSDALWGGLPVVTLPGRQFAARVAASLLHAVGLPELVAKDEADYERIALDLARNPERLAALKEHLVSARRSAPLFDTARFARHLERAFDIAFDRHLAGEAPGDFDVPRVVGPEGSE